eukprot:g82894.t1
MSQLIGAANHITIYVVTLSSLSYVVTLSNTTSRLFSRRRTHDTLANHITSHHITSYHIISHHITSHLGRVRQINDSHHIISHHITSHHIISHHITSVQDYFQGGELMTHLRITSHHITSHHITSHHITSRASSTNKRLTSHHITSHHITSHHITSHHITSVQDYFQGGELMTHLRITSHHITSHHITSHHITSDYFQGGELMTHLRITSHHITSYHITSHHICPGLFSRRRTHDTLANHITSHHITSYHITSHHITSDYFQGGELMTHLRITSHHITSHHITSHHITSVQDYFQGGELMTHLRSEGKFDEQTTRVVTAEIYLAISHLHDKGIVYRDLKPENILLDEKGHICLTDFGMSKDLSTTKSGRSNTFCGTPEFISPEVVEGKEHDRAVDLWGFGVLIYLLICGCTPFAKSLQNPDQQMMTGPDIDNLYRAILTSTILYPKGMSPHCRHLIQCLLNRRPDSRLGYKDKKEVLSHPFYNQINWKDLLHKKLDTGLMPNGKPRSIDEPPPPYETPTPTPLRRRTSNNVQYPLVRTNSKSPAPAPSALKNKLTGSPRVGMGNLVSRVLNLKADEMSLTQPQLSPPVGAASSSSDPSSPQLKASPPPAALSPLFPPLLLDGAQQENNTWGDTEQQENNTDSSPLPDSPTRLTFSRPHTTLNKAVDPSPDLTKAILPTSTNASPFILNTRSARSSVQGNVQQENLLGKVQENLLGQIQENLLGKVQESLLASTVNFPPPPTGDEKDNVNFPPPPTGDEKDNEGKESSRSPMIQESPPRLQEEQEPFAQQHISLLSSFPNAISSLSSFPQPDIETGTIIQAQLSLGRTLSFANFGRLFPGRAT